MPTSMTRKIATEIWFTSQEESIFRWRIPELARAYGCTWEKVWEAFKYAEEEYDVYVARTPFRQEAFTSLLPIRRKLMSDGYEVVPEEVRDKYRH